MTKTVYFSVRKSKNPKHIIAVDCRKSPITMHLFLPHNCILFPKMNENKNAPMGFKLNIYPIMDCETPALSLAKGG